jgi:Tub family
MEDPLSQYLRLLGEEAGFLLQPIPRELGTVQFELVRKSRGLTYLRPEYHLYLEKSSEKVRVLFGKKRPWLLNKTATFYITQARARGDGEEVGKLRSSENKERYFLFSNGENPKFAKKVS